MIHFNLCVATCFLVCLTMWDQHCLMTSSVKTKLHYELLTAGIWFYSLLWVTQNGLNAYRGNSLPVLAVLMHDLPMVPIWQQRGLLEQLISVLKGDFVVKVKDREPRSPDPHPGLGRAGCLISLSSLLQEQYRPSRYPAYLLKGYNVLGEGHSDNAAAAQVLA